MIKQLQDKKIAQLEARLEQSYKIIQELLGGLDCKDEEIRQLIKDVTIEYLKDNK